MATRRPRPVWLRIEPGQTVRITVEGPAGQAAGPADLSPCESDVLTFVRNAGRVVSRADVVRSLDDDEGRRNGHGESTIEHALTRLVRLGLLVKGPGGRGYRAPV